MASEYSILAAETKVTTLEILDSAERIIKNVTDAVNTFLNKNQSTDRSTLDRLLGQVLADRQRINTLPVDDVPYYANTINYRTKAAIDKAYEILNTTKLRSAGSVVVDTVTAIGAGAGKTLANTVEPLLPSIAVLVVLAAILIFVFFRSQRA